jgi:hypothetical protein
LATVKNVLAITHVAMAQRIADDRAQAGEIDAEQRRCCFDCVSVSDRTVQEVVTSSLNDQSAVLVLELKLFLNE